VAGEFGMVLLLMDQKRDDPEAAHPAVALQLVDLHSEL
jgi:hypothetical protein